MFQQSLRSLKICSWHSIYISLITKTSSDQFRVWPFAKIFLYFDLLTLSPTLNLGSLSLCSTPYSIYVLGWTSSGFIFIILHVLLQLSTISSSLSMYTFFRYYSHMLVDPTLQSSDKSLSNNRLYFNVCWIHFNATAKQTWLQWSIVKTAALMYPYLVWFKCKLIQHFLRCISDYNTLFVLQQNTQNTSAVNINNTQ